MLVLFGDHCVVGAGLRRVTMCLISLVLWSIQLVVGALKLLYQSQLNRIADYRDRSVAVLKLVVVMWW